MNSNFRSLACALIVTVFVPFCITGYSSGDDWTRFRGTNGAGVVDSPNLPKSLETHSWKVDLPGSGSSSPVIRGNKLIITSCDSKSASLHIQCFNATTGQQNWKTSFESTPYHLHSRNSFAASTPAIDQDHIYVTYANSNHTFLVALDHSGTEIWRRDFGRWVSMHGFGTSPIVYKDKVVFCNSQQGVRLRQGKKPGSSRVIAVSRMSGETMWESKLETTYACYSVPCIFSDNGKDQIICCSNAEGFYGLNPDSGEMIWTQSAFKMRTVASPVLAGNLVLGSNGSGGGGNYVVAMRIDGDVPSEVYRVNRSANYVPTPVVVNGMAFLFGDKGIATCINVETGHEHWRKRVASGFSGSPVANQKNVYVMDESGNALVFAANEKYSLLSTHALGESTRATPAISGGRIFLRTESKLFCVEASQN